jgi:nitrogen fixation/metabolism regulation signal transduction histidine kinase
MSLAPRTLKGQLTLVFLLLTLVPSLLLTGLATHRLLAALERWENPGVQRALEGSLEVARDLMARTKNDLRQRGQLLAADPALESPIDPDRIRQRLAGAYNLDVLQLYDTDGTLRYEITRDPLLKGPGAIPDVTRLADFTDPFVEDSGQGLLAYVGYAGEPGSTEWILVAGIYLEPDFYKRLDDLSRGVAYYRQVALLKQVNQKAVLLALGLVVVGLGLGSVWIARRLAARLSRPVVNLGRGMERVARGEDRVRVSPEGSAEVEHLIETFNAMSAELSRSRRELARAERLAAWREVARRLAHEMKNALTPITFSLHKLKKATPSVPEEERERIRTAVTTIMEEMDGLRRLAGSFSELARLPVPEFARVDLGEVVEAAVSGTGDDHLRLSWSPPEAPVEVDGDRTLLRQALTNVIRNAADAIGPDGRVWIKLGREGTLARITVEDDGPGWPAEGRDQVFEPYFTTKTHGTGLGLSLVQRTMLLHGGSVELEDRRGGGARVVLTLPLEGGGRGPGGDERGPGDPGGLEA